MRHSQLSNEQILLALSESYNISAAITKYQVFLASAIGLPKDDTGRIELMAGSYLGRLSGMSANMRRPAQAASPKTVVLN